MKIYSKIFNFVALGIAIANVILSLLDFGGRKWCDLAYSQYSGLYLKDAGRYIGRIYDDSVLGSIFFIVSIALVLLALVVIILKFAAKKDIKVLNIILHAFCVVGGILGIIVASQAIAYIVSDLAGTTNAQGHDYAETYFTSGGRFILNSVISLCSLLIPASIVAMVFEFLKKEPKPVAITEEVTQ